MVLHKDSEMGLDKELYETNDQVMETGKYICSEGEFAHFKNGETFSHSPKSGEPTTWRRALDEDQPGEPVRTGII